MHCMRQEKYYFGRFFYCYEDICVCFLLASLFWLVQHEVICSICLLFVYLFHTLSCKMNSKSCNINVIGGEN